MMNVFAAVLRRRKLAEMPVSTVKVPTAVTPVLIAIVMVPDAVLMTVKLNEILTADQVTRVSSVVPKGIVSVNVVPLVTIICGKI